MLRLAGPVLIRSLDGSLSVHEVPQLGREKKAGGKGNSTEERRMEKLREEVLGKTEEGNGRETEGMGEQKISRSGDQGFGSGSSMFSNCGSKFGSGDRSLM
jgi:hypothetical protein